MATNEALRREVLIVLQAARSRLTAGEIADEVGIYENNDTCPTIRQAIRGLIRDGHVIGSTHGGYKLMTTGKEVQTYLNALLKRQLGISQRIQAVYDSAQSNGLL